jgi:hypothetical protein
MIEFQNFSDIPDGFTGTCKILTRYYYYLENKYEIKYDIIHFLNRKYHKEDGPAYEEQTGSIYWYYKGEEYGENNDFTIESWKEKVECLKREEELKIFI